MANLSPDPRVALGPAPAGSRRPMGLQLLTLAWLLLECAVAIRASMAAHSPVLLAFGSDSVIELISASIVLLQWLPRAPISEAKAARAAAVLLFVLAAVVAVVAVLGRLLHVRPEVSPGGIAIAAAALLIMPALARLKRDAAIQNGNVALAADAVQSATCAYLAGVTLAGLVLNAAFHLDWLDSVAALVAVPLLLKEGRLAWRGSMCACR